MFKGDYDFWLDYHSGKINRNLTKEEYSEIRASDFAMHLLIPTEALLKECGGYTKLENIFESENYAEMRKLADKFHVPVKAMIIKISYVLEGVEIAKEKNHKGKIRKRVLKKDNNVIYVKFKK